MKYLLLQKGRLQTVNQRPSIGTWVGVYYIAEAISNDDNDSTLFVEMDSEDWLIDALHDGEYLYSIGCNDSHQEAIEAIVAHLGGE